MAQMYEVFYNDSLIILNSEDNQIRDFDKKVRLTGNAGLAGFLKKYLSEETGGDILLFGYPVEGMFADFCAHFKYLEAAGGLVENSFGATLFIKRLGVWDFPKGKIEKGELTEEAALREVEEETGVTMPEIKYELPSTFHIYCYKEKWILKKTYWYSMKTTFDGVLIPQTEEDIELVEWHKKREAKQLLEKSYRSLRDTFNGYFDA
jgi:8-oxo-dGTP pyrophosphatase MutT (NUDIX family)